MGIPVSIKYGDPRSEKRAEDMVLAIIGQRQQHRELRVLRRSGGHFILEVVCRDCHEKFHTNDPFRMTCDACLNRR